MGNAKPRLLAFFTDQQRAIDSFTAKDWSMLCREAQAANLMGRVAAQLAKVGAGESLPPKIRTRIESALRVNASSVRSIRWEVKKIHEVLSSRDIPFVLLKGAAYEMDELPPSEGRWFTDVDIMVRREDIAQAERSFLGNGWTTTKLNAYDQRYYREWMHEIPPLRNVARKTSLDVHHTILPPTARLKPDAAKLWNAAVALERLPGTYVLGPEDMILHSATHLFHDGDLKGALRDLVDLDLLFRHFSSVNGFADRLVARARVMDLVRPLFYVLKYSRYYLRTPVPDELLAECRSFDGPPWLLARVMDALVDQVTQPRVTCDKPAATAFAEWLLYARSHYLRMPLHLLIPHLVRKALRDEEG